MNCDFDSNYGRCPNECDNNRWRRNDAALEPLDPQFWTLESGITITACKIFFDS